MHKPDPQMLARRETLDALPAMLTLLRRLVISSFDAGDPDSEELKHLLEDCVVAAHRLRLREQLSAREALEHG